MTMASDSAPVTPPLKLVDALRIMAQNPPVTAAEKLKVALVCGFTPLHLQTFLGAELRLRYPDHHVEVATGLYDDIPGTLRGLGSESFDAIVLVLEWADIDARLGLRRLGGWSPHQLTSIVDHTHARLAHIRALLEQVSITSPVIIVLPALPFPPLFFTAGWQAGVDELRLREGLWSFAVAVAQQPRVRVISEQALHLCSPFSERLNVKSTWLSGFPYRNQHAARVAELLGKAIHSRLPKKGLITDLDDTLWSGIVGDDGPDRISWDMDHQSQAHGLYQQFLSTLSDEGVLIGVASKNDPGAVNEAFAREDLLLSKDKVFPLAVGWGSKAHSVTQVLSTWNVNADSVVFVDDNLTELAEVKAAHPALECVHFPRRDAGGVYDLLGRLRDLFGRSAVSEEDAIRVESVRASAGSPAPPADSDGYSEALLREADAEVAIDFSRDVRDVRALELVNKTNQFNLNGRRFTERAWTEYLQDAQAFLLTASYKDRFGRLGKIAALAGHVEGSAVRVDVWVMSCRAFARRIEHQCLNAVFERFAARSISFEYRETARNAPVARFLAQVLAGTPPASPTLTSSQFRAACPALFHHVIVKDDLGDERYAGAAR